MEYDLVDCLLTWTLPGFVQGVLATPNTWYVIPQSRAMTEKERNQLL